MLKKLNIVLAAMIGVATMMAPLMLMPSSTYAPKAIVKDEPLMQGLLRGCEQENKTTFVKELEKAQEPVSLNSMMPIALASVLSLIPAFAISVYVKKRMGQRISERVKNLE